MKNLSITTGSIILALTLATISCTTISPAPDQAAGSGIRGVILSKETGKPVAGAHVYAYSDPAKNLIGVADHVSKGSAPDGSYTLEMPPGEYYFVSRQRASGSNYGPIVTGDLYDHRYEQDPVRLHKGQVIEMNFDLLRLSEPMFFQVFTEPERTTDTGITGRILDDTGEPVQGAFATAYRDENMKRLPDYASTLSGDNGNYKLYLPEGGKWYVGARSHARGVPRPGELIGRYEGSADHSLQVPAQGFVDGVEITLKPFISEPPAGYVPY
ncbi:MAG: carboxypeptidase-like regulatory domain-containing protein [bacterium]|nr:carboxypeptidase-like regulatory domain-containing protein [bacterium]